MANGLMFNGECVQPIVWLSSTFPRAYPLTTATQTTFEVLANWSYSSTGILTYSTKLSTNNNNATLLVTNRPMQFTYCVAPDNVAFSYIEIAQYWSFAFTTIISLWYLSKNLGAIINAVKRF